MRHEVQGHALWSFGPPAGPDGFVRLTRHISTRPVVLL